MNPTSRPLAHRKTKSSVSTKIILVQMTVVLIAMGGYGLVSYMQRSSQLNKSIHMRENQIQQRLPAGLAIPLWNLDTASVDALVGLEMMDPDVHAIVVTSDSGARGKVRDEKGLPVDYTESNGSNLA